MGFVPTPSASRELRCNGSYKIKGLSIKSSDGFDHEATNGAAAEKQKEVHDSPTLAPLSGIRALACATIVCIHVAHWVNLSVEDKFKLHRAFEISAWWNYLYQPDPPMDAFMTLTGFLAAWSLLPALEQNTSYLKTLNRYYLKRIWRIVPPYYLALAGIHYFFMPLANNPNLHGDLWRGFFEPRAAMDKEVCATSIWRNLTFSNNQMVFAGCWNITWSLCVQMQFYATFPLALILLRPQTPGFRKRVAALCISAIVGVMGYRAWQMFSTRLWVFLPIRIFKIIDPEMQKTIDFLARHSYVNFLSRLAALGTGVLTAMAVSDKGFRQWVGRNRQTIYRAWIGLFLFLAGSGVPNKIGNEPDPNHVAANIPMLFINFVLTQAFLSPLFYAIMLTVVTTRQPGLGNFLTRLLSAKPLARLADLSYDVYLIHSFVIYGIWTVYPPSMWWDTEKPGNFVLVFLAVFTLTTTLAWLHHKMWDAIRGAISPKQKAT